MDLGSPLMLKFGLEIDFGVIQKRYAAILEMLIFREFSGGQSSNLCYFDKILVSKIRVWSLLYSQNQIFPEHAVFARC